MIESVRLTETKIIFLFTHAAVHHRSATSKSNVSVNNSVDAKPAPRGFAPNTNI